jgi:hypothetical protein
MLTIIVQEQLILTVLQQLPTKKSKIPIKTEISQIIHYSRLRNPETVGKESISWDLNSTVY